jgi:hypothetical protein
MTVHRETLSEDVGGKLLLLASMLALFGVIALVLMPLGAAFAPPPEVVPDAALPEGPPAIVGAIMPGLVMLVVAAIVGACAGLLLGHARARAEEAAAAEDVATPH